MATLRFVDCKVEPETIHYGTVTMPCNSHHYLRHVEKSEIGWQFSTLFSVQFLESRALRLTPVAFLGWVDGAPASDRYLTISRMAHVFAYGSQPDNAKNLTRAHSNDQTVGFKKFMAILIIAMFQVLV